MAQAVGVTVPNSFVGATDETPLKLLRAFSAAGRHLRTKNWRSLTYEHTFDTADGTLAYALPTSPAFDRLVAATTYDRTQFRGATGPYSPAQWQYGEALLSSPGQLNTVFRIKRNASRVDQLFLLDDPGGTYTIAFEYVTNEWIYDGSSTYYADVQADADVPLFDDFLMELETTWRALRALGEPYFDEKAEAIERAEMLYAQENPMVLDMRPRVRRFTNLIDNVPETGYGL